MTDPPCRRREPPCDRWPATPTRRRPGCRPSTRRQSTRLPLSGAVSRPADHHSGSVGAETDGDDLAQRHDARRPARDRLTHSPSLRDIERHRAAGSWRDFPRRGRIDADNTPGHFLAPLPFDRLADGRPDLLGRDRLGRQKNQSRTARRESCRPSGPGGPARTGRSARSLAHPGANPPEAAMRVVAVGGPQRLDHPATASVEVAGPGSTGSVMIARTTPWGRSRTRHGRPLVESLRQSRRQAGNLRAISTVMSPMSGKGDPTSFWRRGRRSGLSHGAQPGDVAVETVDGQPDEVGLL